MYKKRTSIVSLLCSIAVALLIFACADDGGSSGGGGGDTKYDYVCANGTEDDGQTTEQDTTKCVKCNSGYLLVGEECQTFGITLENATAGATSATVDATATHDVTLHWVLYAAGTTQSDAAAVKNGAADNSIVGIARSGTAGISLTATETKQITIDGDGISSNTSYVLYAVITANDDTLVLSQPVNFTTAGGFDYACDNGAKANGTTDTEGTINCQSCDSYYKLADITDTDRKNCVQTVYFCDNGTPATGNPNATDDPDVVDKNDDVEKCISCTDTINDIVHNGVCQTFVFSSAPAETGTTSGGATITATASHDATLHWVVYADGTSKTDAATVVDDAKDDSTVVVAARSGTDGISVMAGQSVPFTVGGSLDSATDYTAYVVITSTASDTVRALSAAIDFTTLAAGIPGFTTQPTATAQLTTATITLTVDEGPNLYWVLAKTQQTYATTADLKTAAEGMASGDIVEVSGSGGVTVTADTPKEIALGGTTALKPLTEYFFYALVEDSENNQTASTELPFQTAGYPFVCEFGDKIDGSNATEGIIGCASCNNYYKLDTGTNNCVQTEYFCSNGGAADGNPAQSEHPAGKENEDVEKCASCMGTNHIVHNNGLCVQFGFSAAPAASDITQNDVTLSGATATHDATLHWVVYAATATLPTTAASLINDAEDGSDAGIDRSGTAGVALTAGTAMSPIDITGLIASTEYVIYAAITSDAVKDTAIADSNVVILSTPASFTTEATPVSCPDGYSLPDGATECVLNLVGLWQFDTTNTCTSSSCFVVLRDDDDQSVAWYGDCSADQKPHAPSHTFAYEIDMAGGQPVGLTFDTPGTGLPHNYTLDEGTDDDGNTYVTLNPQSTSFLNINRYLCPRTAPAAALFNDSIGTDSASFTIASPYAGTLYWILYTDGATEPTAASLITDAKNGTGGVARSATGGIAITELMATDTIDLTGLSDKTAYDLYVALEIDGADPILSQKVDFTTPSADAPAFDAGPTASDILQETATVTLTADKDAELYWVLYDSAQTTLTAADLKTAAEGTTAGVDRSGSNETVDAYVSATISLTNLAPATDYYFYAVLEDDADMQTLSTAVSFTTAGCDDVGYTLDTSGTVNECVLELVGLWQFDIHNDNICSTNSCFVAMDNNGMVSWHGDCSTEVTPTQPATFSVEHQLNRLTYGTQDFIVEQIEDGVNFQLNPQSNTFGNANRYLCPHTGLTPITAGLIGTDSASFSIASSDSGTFHWVLYVDDATAPTTADELITAATGGTAGVARSGASGLNATAFQGVAISISNLLTQNTSYDLYVAFDDGTTKELLDKYDLTTACPAGQHGGSTADGTCSLNQYICTHGDPVVASSTDFPPTHNNVEKCTMCTGDYVMDSNSVCSFLVVEHVDDMNNVIGRTLTCDLAAVGATAMIDLDGDGTEYAMLAYTKRTRQEISSDRDNRSVNACTSGITDMSRLYYNDTDFNLDITHWDTSSVTDMSQMFYKNDNFVQDISFWDVSNVTDMSQMFLGRKSSGTEGGNRVGSNPIVSRWNTGKVKNMQDMFKENGNFNDDISGWDVSSVTNMAGMFRVALSFNADISNWDVRKVEKGDMGNMFRTATSFAQDISEWCVSHIKEKPSDFDTDTNSTTWPNDNKPQWNTARGNNCPINFTEQPAINSDNTAVSLTASKVGTVTWILYDTNQTLNTFADLDFAIGNGNGVQRVDTSDSVMSLDDVEQEIMLSTLDPGTYYFYAGLQTDNGESELSKKLEFTVQ